MLASPAAGHRQSRQYQTLFRHSSVSHLLCLDRFKQVNHLCEHLAGEPLLRQLGIDYAQGYHVDRHLVLPVDEPQLA